MNKSKKGLTDTMKEIRADQIARGYTGRTEEEMKAEEELQKTENEEYDQKMEEFHA